MKYVPLLMICCMALSGFAQTQGILTHITPSDSFITTEVVLTNNGTSGGKVFLEVHRPDDVHITENKRGTNLFLQAGETRIIPTSDPLIESADYIYFTSDHDLIRVETRYQMGDTDPVYLPAQQFATSFRFRLSQVKEGWLGMAVVRDWTGYSPPMSQLTVKALDTGGQVLASSSTTFITRFDKYLTAIGQDLIGLEDLAFIEIEATDHISAVLLKGDDQLTALSPWQTHPDGLTLSFDSFDGLDSYRIEQKGNTLTRFTKGFRSEQAETRYMHYEAIQQFYGSIAETGIFEMQVPSRESDHACDPANFVRFDIRKAGQRNAFHVNGCQFLDDEPFYESILDVVTRIKELTDEIMLQE